MEACLLKQSQVNYLRISRNSWSWNNELIHFETSKHRRTGKGLQEREQLLKQIVENLERNTGSKNHNVYENEFSLIRTQDLLLVLLMHWLNAWDTINQIDVRHYYYKIMKLAFKSSELDLAHIGFKGYNSMGLSFINQSVDAFNQSSSKLDFDKKSSKGYTKTNAFMINSKEVNQSVISSENVNMEDIKRYQKILISLNYQFILNKTLKYSLQKLTKKGGISDFYLREFIEKFIPIAYFRIPIFREKFLKLLLETFQEEDQHSSSNEMEWSVENDGSYKDNGDTTDDQNKRKLTSRSKKSSRDNEIDEWFRIEFPKKDQYNDDYRPFDEKESKQYVNETDDLSDSEWNSSNNAIINDEYLECERGYEGAITHIFDWDKYFYSHLPKENEQK